MLLLASREGEVYNDLLSEAPEIFYPATRLKFDLEALEFLLEGIEPTKIPCRLKNLDGFAMG